MQFLLLPFLAEIGSGIYIPVFSFIAILTTTVGNDAVILTDLQDTDKTCRCSIQPYLDSSQVEHVHLLSPDKNIRVTFFMKENNYVQFQEKRLLILNKNLSGIRLSQKLGIDYLYICGPGNSDADLVSVNKN